MSSPVIKVENLGKKYRIGGPVGRFRYRTLRDTLMDVPKALLRRLRGGHAYQDETIWALKDVSFEVKQREVVGIIGRNGAGKTTLLKVLSRITEPTEGRVELRGRVSSLLEVGTGFHPELTGRENIYLNGAILGMKRTEIKQKFDEIVAFAEIEKFMDTPVKRYSSGMYVRLAFAVAAHLEPEILLVDEVLSVGDAAFQKKCLGKMGDVAKGGRTVLFVSHNMSAIQNLCSICILLKDGKINSIGETNDVVNFYLQSIVDASGSRRSFLMKEGSPIFFKEATIENRNAKIYLEIIYEVTVDSIGILIAIKVDSSNGETIMAITDCDVDSSNFKKNRGIFKYKVDFPSDMLMEGRYFITLSAADMKSERFDYQDHVVFFDVRQNPNIVSTFTRRKGVILFPTIWKREVI